MPFSTNSNLLVERRKQIRYARHDKMQKSIDVGEVLTVRAIREIADCLRGQLYHVLIYTPRPIATVKFIEYSEQLAGTPPHQQRIMPHYIGSRRGWEELAYQTPVLCPGVFKEDSSVVFHPPGGIILIDLFRHIG